MPIASASSPDLSSRHISRAVEAGRAAALVDFMTGLHNAAEAFKRHPSVEPALFEMFQSAYGDRIVEFATRMTQFAMGPDTCLVVLKTADAIAVGHTNRALARTSGGDAGEAMNRVGAQLVAAGMAAQKAAG